MPSAEPGRRIGGRRQLTGGLASGRIRRDFGGSRDGNANSEVPVEMIFPASRAISLAGILVAKTGEFVAAANAVAVTSFGSGFDRYEWHGVSLGQHEKHDTDKNNPQGAMSQRQLGSMGSGWLDVAYCGTSPIFFKCVRRKGEPRFSRSSIQWFSGMERNTFTILGSNCVPAQRRISSRA
jgi:hypothetical protein